MSCNDRNLRNLDTNIYSSENNCCGNDVDVRYIERLVPYCCYPPRPLPPTPPSVQPPMPPFIPTLKSYAQFFNNSATGATFSAGENIAFPSTLYNTDNAEIINNNGLITLLGGENGKTYLVSYQVTGRFADEATLALAINGTVDANTQIVPDGESGTANGNYIVSIPAGSTSTLALRVASGTVTTSSPTVGTNFSVIEIA